MKTILVAPPKPSLKGRILAIEPDAARARSLRDVLEAHVNAQVEIVTSTDAAVRAIGQHIPDVVLTSTFLTPSDEVRLTAHLKALPAASHVQVIITPHFIDAEEAPKTHVFGLRRNRSDRVRPACDHGTLIRQIGEYLQQARAQADLAARQELRSGVVCGAGAAGLARPDMRLVERTGHDRKETRRPLARFAGRPLPASRATAVVRLAIIARSCRGCGRPSCRGEPRSRSWTSRRRGVLVETTSRITLGSTLDLQFVGQNANVSIPARILRTDVAHVNALGVRYRVAASFNRDLDLLEPYEDAAAPAAKPAALAEMLARVLADVDRRSSPRRAARAFRRRAPQDAPGPERSDSAVAAHVERPGRLDLL